MNYKSSITVNEDGRVVYERIAVKTMIGKKIKQHTVERREVDGLNLFNSLNLSTPKILLLPEKTRFFQAQDDYLVVVIEDGPQIRNTFWDWDFIEGEYKRVLRRKNVKKYFGVKRPRELKKTTFRLAFPYVLYFLLFHQGTFSEMWLFYRTEPLKTERDILLAPNLPNISEDGQVCLGDGWSLGENSPQFISRQASGVIQRFWGSQFNHDLCDGYREYQEEVKEFKTVWDWERESKNNPLFPLRVCWKGISETVEDVLNHIFEYHAGRRKALTSSPEELFYFLTKAIFRTASK